MGDGWSYYGFGEEVYGWFMGMRIEELIVCFGIGFLIGLGIEDCVKNNL